MATARPIRFLVAAALVVSAAAWSAGVLSAPAARNLYVSTRGSDANDGLTPEKAFRTIRRAAAVVEPGDTVQVAGGTYFEHVHLTRPGTAERPIVFRAAPRETVVVTFAQEPASWKKVDGRRFIYAAPYSRLPVSVWEDRTITRYVGLDNIPMLDELPGSFFFDRAAQLLYVHPLRSSLPEDARVLVVPASDSSGQLARLDSTSPYASDKGFWHRAPHNIVEGFVIAYQPIGIQIRTDLSCDRNNTAYGCVGGFTIHEGSGGVIEGNTAFRNDSHGILVSGAGRQATVRGNLTYDNGPAGPFPYLSGSYGNPYNMAVYGPATDVTFTGNTVIATQPSTAWRYKSAHGKIVTTGNVVVGGSADVTWGSGADYSHNTVVGGTLRSRDEPAEVITPAVAGKHNSVAGGVLTVKTPGEGGFADPARDDYRLRADSPHVGQGAFPEPAPLRYVSPVGSDAADGRTPKSAWKSLARAAAGALPGDTVYVLPGTYTESVTLSTRATAARPLSLKSYGRGRVVLDGQGRLAHGFLIQGAANVELDGFILKGYTGAAVAVERGEGIALSDMVLAGGPLGVAVRESRDVRVLNDTFAGCRKGIEGVGGAGEITIRNTLFAGIGETAVDLDAGAERALVSERNAFDLSAPAVAGVLGGRRAASLEEWAKLAGEAHPSLAAKVAVSEPDYLLPTGSTLAYVGVGHKPIGARGARPDASPISIEGFGAASVSPDQAVVAWSTPSDYTNATLTWEGPGGEKGRLPVSQGSELQLTRMAARIPRLAPGRTYRVALEVRDAGGRRGSANLVFETPQAVRPSATLHVSPEGSDTSDGLTPAKPLRTLSAASLRAVPGDTILVSPGVYREKLRFWCGGLSKEKPLTLRSARQGEAIIDLGGVLPGAIDVQGVSHVAIEGFRIRGLWYGGPIVVNAVNVTDLRLLRNFFEPPQGSCSSTLIRAADCRELIIQHNAVIAGFNSIQMYGCDDVVVDHNTFFRGGVNALQFDGGEKARCRITNNVFMDVMSENKSNPAVMVYRRSPGLVCDHNLYWRSAVPGMGLFSYHYRESGEVIPWGENAKTIAEVRARCGVEQHGAFGDPLFVDAGKGDFRLKPGSPAIGLAEDGGTVGAFGAGQ